MSGMSSIPKIFLGIAGRRNADAIGFLDDLSLLDHLPPQIFAVAILREFVEHHVALLRSLELAVAIRPLSRLRSNTKTATLGLRHEIRQSLDIASHIVEIHGVAESWMIAKQSASAVADRVAEVTLVHLGDRNDLAGAGLPRRKWTKLRKEKLISLFEILDYLVTRDQLIFGIDDSLPQLKNSISCLLQRVTEFLLGDLLATLDNFLHLIMILSILRVRR